MSPEQEWASAKPLQADWDAAKPVRSPSLYERLLGASIRGLVLGGPQGAMFSTAGEMVKKGNELTEEAAYETGGRVAEKTGSPALGYAANVGMQALPLAVGGVSRAVSPALEWTGRKLMQSAIKPLHADLMSGKADRAAQTLLDEGLNVSRSGVDALYKRASGFDRIVDDVVARAGQAGLTVDKGKVAARVQDYLSKQSKNPFGTNNEKIAEDVITEFMSRPVVAGRAEVPVQLAQDMKRAGYREVKETAYGPNPQPARVESQKAINRGFKEELEAVIPELKIPNSQSSRLYNALNVMERRALHEASKDPGSWALLSHSPETFAAITASRSSVFKSLLARALYGGSGVIPVGTGVGGTLLIEGKQ